MSEPRTEAGRALDIAWPGTHLDRLQWRDSICTIEDEAAAREAVALDALREARARTHHDANCHATHLQPGSAWMGQPCSCPLLRVDAILANPSPAAARLLAVVEAARALQRAPDEGLFPVDEWDTLADALRALDGEA